MKARKIWALAILALGVAAASGCASQDDSGDDTATDQGELGLRVGSVDHAAIVEVTTMMLTSVADDPTDFATVLDPYNQDDPFKIHASSYAAQFNRNLAKFDREDGQTNWTPAQAKQWVNHVSSGNYQILDTTKPFDYQDPHTYLEIERAQLTGREHTTCGGRMPNEDALDVTLNFLIRGPAASALDEGAITDGVDQATQRATDTFPYLAEMNGI